MTLRKVQYTIPCAGTSELHQNHIKTSGHLSLIPQYTHRFRACKEWCIYYSDNCKWSSRREMIELHGMISAGNILVKNAREGMNVDIIVSNIVYIVSFAYIDVVVNLSWTERLVSGLLALCCLLGRQWILLSAYLLVLEQAPESAQIPRTIAIRAVARSTICWRPKCRGY